MGASASTSGRRVRSPLPVEQDTRHLVLCGDALNEGVDYVERNGLQAHLIVTSPPHATGADYDVFDDDLELDEYLAFVAQLLGAADRMLRPGGRIALNLRDVRISTGNYFPIVTHLYRELCERRGYKYRRHHTWSKVAAESNQKAWGSFRSSSNPSINSCAEPIFIFGKPGPRRRGKDNITAVEFAEFSREIWEVPPVRRINNRGGNCAGHPCPWPVEIPRRLCLLYSCVGDTVIDLFGGIGSTAVAAALAGRRSISMDISRSYSDRAVQRLHSEAPAGINVERVDLRRSERSKPSELREGLPAVEELASLPASLGEAARVRRAMVHEGAFVAAGRRRMSEGGRRGGQVRQGLAAEKASGSSVRPLSREAIAEHLAMSGSKYAQCRRVLIDYDGGRCPLAQLYELGVLRVDAVERARRVLGLEQQQQIVDEVMARSPSERMRVARELLRSAATPRS